MNDRNTINYMLKDYSENDISKKALNLIKPKSYVLSAGCGAGREVNYLVNVLKCKVVAIDMDSKVLFLSKDKVPNAQYILGNIIWMKFKKKFDYIVCLWNTINYLDRKSRKKFVETCYDNLKEDGELIITTTHIFSHWRHLLHNIKYNQHYHPFPWEIKEWFKDTSFKISFKLNIHGTVLVVATKK